MKPLILTTAFFLLFNILHGQLNVISDPKWDLVTDLSDEFNDTLINSTKWKGIMGFEDRMNFPNCTFNDATHAFQRPYFPNENVILNNGVASILVRNEPTDVIVKCIICDTCAEDWQTQNVTFTVGALISQKLIKYGYFELKFKLPSSPTNPLLTYKPFGANFWLFNEYPFAGPTTSCYSEIDFFEIIDGQSRTYTTNTHFTYVDDPGCGDGTNGHLHDDNSSAPFVKFGPGSITGNTWHTAGANWTPDRLDFYLDGKLIKRNSRDWVASLDSMTMIININASLSNATLLASNNLSYPYSYDIDYIRVYQLDESCGTEELIYCGTTPDVTDGYTVQKNITFGGSSCGGANFVNITNSLYANEYILLDENTTLGGGSGTLYLDVNNCYNP